MLSHQSQNFGIGLEALASTSNIWPQPGLDLVVLFVLFNSNHSLHMGNGTENWTYRRHTCDDRSDTISVRSARF